MSGKPIRVQLSRKKGWKMPPNTVKVDRSNVAFGNPFVVGELPPLAFWKYHRDFVETAEQAVSLYRRMLLSNLVSDAAVDALLKLRGKNLACWCALDKPCHADVLLEIANAPICEPTHD